MESNAAKPVYPRLVPFPTKSDSQPISLEPGDHGGVSRVHARISHENGQHILTDLDSRNGTFVNNKRINQAALNHNDKIFFGNRGFIFLTKPAELAHAPSDIDFDGEDTVTISEEEPRIIFSNRHHQKKFKRSRPINGCRYCINLVKVYERPKMPMKFWIKVWS
jgi:hypothetical protein